MVSAGKSSNTVLHRRGAPGNLSAGNPINLPTILPTQPLSLERSKPCILAQGFFLPSKTQPNIPLPTNFTDHRHPSGYFCMIKLQSKKAPSRGQTNAAFGFAIDNHLSAVFLKHNLPGKDALSFAKTNLFISLWKGHPRQAPSPYPIQFWHTLHVAVKNGGKHDSKTF